MFKRKKMKRVRPGLAYDRANDTIFAATDSPRLVDLLGGGLLLAELRRRAGQVRLRAATLDVEEGRDRRRPRLGRQELRKRQAGVERRLLGAPGQALANQGSHPVEPFAGEEPVARLF